MKKGIFLTISLALISLFFVACGDNNTTVDDKNCANACDKTWQQCNEETQKCEPKEGFCADDEGCKADETKPKCNSVTHVCVADRCSDDPCATNTENGNTLCELDGTEEGFSCVCEDGFELEGEKCVEVVVDPCDPNPCKDNTDGKTECKADESEAGYECVAPAVDPCDPNPCKDDTDGKTECKADESEAGYECVAPVVDPCDSNPCESNTDGQTKCEEADNTDGYTCSCEEGFEFVTDKCVQQTCIGTNECDTLDATKCDTDKLLKCVTDDSTYCTVWKEETDCGSGLCKDNDDGAAYCEANCEETADSCTDLGTTKCTGDRLFECVADSITYCTVWKEQEDCGAGLCTDNGDGAALCECQECDPDTFNSVCSEDLNSFDYCDNTDGCFTIKTINCDAGKHCGEPDANGNLSCVDTSCSDECEENQTKCDTAANASFFVECKKSNDGCFYWDDDNRVNCTANNMTCSEYNNETMCLGGEGNATCQNNGSNNSNNEILMNGIWVGNTKNQSDDYQGCGDDVFEGQDAVYVITVEQGANLNLRVKKLDEDSTTFRITPAIYVMKGNCNAQNDCNSATADNNDADAKTTLALTNMDAGVYHIIIDSDKVKDPTPFVGETYDTYKYELTVDLQ